MFFLIFVLFGVRSGIAALPESFNKIVALFIVGKLFECARSWSVIIQTTSSFSHFL